MKKRLTLLFSSLFTAFLLTLAGCSAMGDLYGIDGDNLWITPIRMVYNVYTDTFLIEDFEVYTSHKGTILHVPKDQLKRVEIYNDGAFQFGDAEPLVPEVDDEHVYIFDTKGTYRVYAYFLHMSAYYKIQVLDLDGIGKEETPSGGNGGGIIIEWAKRDDNPPPPPPDPDPPDPPDPPGGG